MAGASPLIGVGRGRFRRKVPVLAQALAPVLAQVLAPVLGLALGPVSVPGQARSLLTVAPRLMRAGVVRAAGKVLVA